MEYPATRTLPPHTSFSPPAISNLSSTADLHGAPNLLSELRIQCETLDQTLCQLGEDLRSHLTRYYFHSDRVGSLSNSIRYQLHYLRQSSSTQSLPDGRSRRGMG